MTSNGNTLFIFCCVCCMMQDPIVVIDPFSGTGSAGVAALRSGSYFIGIDKDSECVVCEAHIAHAPQAPSYLVCTFLSVPAQDVSREWLIAQTFAVDSGGGGDTRVASNLVTFAQVRPFTIAALCVCLTF